MTDVATTLNRDLTASLEQPSTKRRTRRRLFVFFAASMIVAAGSWWVWSTFLAADNVATENAYTNVEVSQVTPLVGGPVERVLVVNSQHVRAGDVLVELDDADLRLAVEQADATLARARREVRRLLENDVQLAGQERMRRAEKATAQADLVRAQDIYVDANFKVESAFRSGSCSFADLKTPYRKSFAIVLADCTRRHIRPLYRQSRDYFRNRERSGHGVSCHVAALAASCVTRRHP
jgi:hypothetical protein